MKDLAALGLSLSIKQENISRSSQHVIRGLHYQKSPKAQAKWVHVAYGCIFDVAVDIRPESPTYLQWVSAVLSDKNRHMLMIPAGFAHGFYVMSDYADVIYKCDAYYAPDYEGSIHWHDDTLAIAWPLGAASPIVSPKDSMAPCIHHNTQPL